MCRQSREKKRCGRKKTRGQTHKFRTCGATLINPPDDGLASVTLSTRLDFGSQGTRSSVTASLGIGPKNSWKAEAWMLIWSFSQVGHESYCFCLDFFFPDEEDGERGRGKKKVSFFSRSFLLSLFSLSKTSKRMTHHHHDGHGQGPGLTGRERELPRRVARDFDAAPTAQLVCRGTT